MNPEQIKAMAQQFIAAMNDTRTVVPGQYTTGLANAKEVMLGLMSGQLVIENAKQPEMPTLKDEADAPSDAAQH